MSHLHGLKTVDRLPGALVILMHSDVDPREEVAMSSSINSGWALALFAGLSVPARRV
jgi:hypothetical protein